MNLWNKLWSRPAPRPSSNSRRSNRTTLRLENLESRDVMSTTPSMPAPPPPPPPTVLPLMTDTSTKDTLAALAAVPSDDTSATVFVGGWGASMYQYDTVSNAPDAPKTNLPTVPAYSMVLDPRSSDLRIGREGNDLLVGGRGDDAADGDGKCDVLFGGAGVTDAGR